MQLEINNESVSEISCESLKNEFLTGPDKK